MQHQPQIYKKNSLTPHIFFIIVKVITNPAIVSLDKLTKKFSSDMFFSNKKKKENQVFFIFFLSKNRIKKIEKEINEKKYSILQKK